MFHDEQNLFENGPRTAQLHVRKVANDQNHACATLRMGNKAPAGLIQCAPKQRTLQAVPEPYENKHLAFQPHSHQFTATNYHTHH